MYRIGKFLFVMTAISALTTACAYDEDGGTVTPDPVVTCAIQCKPTQYCLNGTTCADLLKGGDVCTANTACISGVCYGGECTCDEKSGCTGNAHCVKDADGYNVCIAYAKNGEACTSDAECASGDCNEGKCNGCKTKADCGTNEICDISVCRPIVSCPSNPAKKCFLDTSLTPSEDMLNGGTITVPQGSENFVGTTYTPMLSFDDNNLNACGLLFASPVLTSIMAAETISLTGETNQQIISYLATHDYAWALFFEYYIDMLASQASARDKSKSKEEYVAEYNEYFKDVNAPDKAEQFWAKSLDMVMAVLTAAGAPATKEIAQGYIIKETLTLLKEKFTTDPRFYGRATPKCFESILNSPTNFTFVNNGSWKNNNFYLVLNVSDSLLMLETQITNNKFYLSATPDYASGIAKETHYSEYLQFPVSATMNDFGKSSKLLTVRYEPSKCSNDALTQNSRLHEKPTCEAGYHQFYIKTNYVTPESYSCEAYYTMTGRCKEANCNQAKYTSNMSSPDTAACRPGAYIALNKVEIYVELTDEDLK